MATGSALRARRANASRAVCINRERDLSGSLRNQVLEDTR